MIRAAHRALLRPTDALRDDEVEAELARLDLFLMKVAQGAVTAATLLLTRFARAHIYLLKLALITVAVSQFRVPRGSIWVGLALPGDR